MDPAIRPQHTNRLAREKSPYLLQHAHNPVDWFAWGEDAFEKARREHKPVFLSIGYSTCHWCHVMERESFEDPKIGAFLNEHFVSIKVDREERPDVDRIYMTFVQATTRSGGWPMNVFLTPELKPFYGGTYFPPDNRFGRPGFLQLLQRIAHLWETRRDNLMHSAADVHAGLEQAMAAGASSGGAVTADLVRRAGSLLKQLYDPLHGGFGAAPKFPQPSQPQLLLRYARRFGDGEAVRMVLHTCERMAAGGIHDQLGGGFARYSVDAEWLVPHFEKMLYDNAQLVHLYLDAYLVAKENESREPQVSSSTPNSSIAETCAGVARSILTYVLRDMTDRDGGFYSAEDADSEGHEGKFYCWTRAELEQLLTPAEFEVAARHFGITGKGNFVDHSHPTPLLHQNVLSIVAPVASEERLLLVSAKHRMFDARSKRVRPHRDDKVLTSWNGLMLGAFARAYEVLGDETYRDAAEKNLAFVRGRLWDAPSASDKRPGQAREASAQHGRLYHRWRDGERDTVQLLDAYAFQLAGVLELYEATLEPRHLEFAIALGEAMLANFYDGSGGGFWQSVAGATDLILRVKEDYDGAEPSGNSVATLSLLKLAAIAGRADFRAAAEKTLRFFAARLEQAPQVMPYMLQAVDFSLQEPVRAVVAGAPDSAAGRGLLQAIHSVYHPNKVVLGNTGPVEEFARTLGARDGPVVYLCTGSECRAPTNDPGTLQETLRSA